MPSLFSQKSDEPALGDLLVLVDEQADSRVEICPQRGALVSSFRVRGRELLYLEPATLRDPTKNVRGGIPVLFPSPGPLRGDHFERDGRRGALKQHGFARTLPWSASATQDSVAQVTLRLADSEQTRAQFPWRFALSLTFTLDGARLAISLRLHNPGSEPLPFAFGLHPYFVVTDKVGARIETRATRVYDNVEKRQTAFTGFDLSAAELDLHLLDHGSTRSALCFGDGQRIELRASSEFKRWVVWALRGKDFVCVEPWTAPFDALNSGEDLLYVAPGSVHEGFVELELC